jgi:hypothetical protein
VQNDAGFQGEIEFLEGVLPDEDFGNFQSLPNIGLIHELASEFSNNLELMPYQIVGDVKRLLVSVYLQTKYDQGKVIAVLVRDPYPRDWSELEKVMSHANERLLILDALAETYPPESIDTARKALAKLAVKVRDRVIS